MILLNRNTATSLDIAHEADISDQHEIVNKLLDRVRSLKEDLLDIIDRIDL